MLTLFSLTIITVGYHLTIGCRGRIVNCVKSSHYYLFLFFFHMSRSMSKTISMPNMLKITFQPMTWRLSFLRVKKIWNCFLWRQVGINFKNWWNIDLVATYFGVYYHFSCSYIKQQCVFFCLTYPWRHLDTSASLEREERRGMKLHMCFPAWLNSGSGAFSGKYVSFPLCTMLDSKIHLLFLLVAAALQLRSFFNRLLSGNCQNIT